MNDQIVNYEFVMPQKYKHPDNLAEHLGGHEGETHLDDGALSYLVETFKVSSMVDIGCGPGGMVKHALDKNINVIGIDGDNIVERPEEIKNNILLHDYSSGPLKLEKIYDLGWCIEFVEHVDVEYMPNFIETFKGCKYVAMTHALPGQPGHHHVNCKPFEYWLGVMEYNGFKLLVDETNEMRKASTMKERYIRQQGYVFKNGRI